jgi:transcriptional regulator with XRE-family HTH domain
LKHHHRHSAVEIAAKLAEAKALTAEGKSQNEIARTLGVSVMTFHRWRKAHSQLNRSDFKNGDATADDPTIGSLLRLESENFRLRRLLTDLLLERHTFAETQPKRAF